ncbi:MAG: hypothetical protein ACOYNZ_01345 [Rhodoferax sp.]
MDDRHAESMNPRLLLALWRERWGKPVDKTLATPYLHGQPNIWGHRLTHMWTWSLPGVTLLFAVVCLVLFGFLLSVELDLSGQIIFSIFFVFLAIYAQRYAGTLISLVLLCLAVIVCARYLYWRFSATLAKDISSAFAFGFGLCVAEAHLWLLTFVRSTQTLWPLKQNEVPLPVEPGGLPTVDIYIACHDQPLAAVKSTALAALALDWPKQKSRIYLLDILHREDIQALSESIGCTCLAQPDDSHDNASSINHALAQTHGDLVAIIEGDQPPPADLLRMTVGWFLHDVKLGMVQTPRHFLAPPPSARIMGIFDKPDLAGSCSLIRRSVLLEIGGIDSETISSQHHTALKMQTLGYNTAYFSVTTRPTRSRPRQTTRIQQHAPSPVEAFQVDHPFGDRSLLWKQRLKYLNDMLEFYGLFPRLAFLAAPLIYLLLNISIIDTTAALLVAYILPLLVHRHIALQRLERHDRFTFWTDIRETALAWYLLMLTTITVIRTELSSFTNTFKINHAHTNAVFKWQVALPFIAIFILTAAALVVSIERLPRLDSNSQAIAVLFCLWSLYNMTILAAKLAVTEEIRSIQRHTSRQIQIPAMIKLLSGHTVSCVTKNFPDIALALELPAPIAIENGETVNISVFYANREYSFPAIVDLEPDLVLRVHIDGSAQNVYRSLGVAAYSRGQDWPKWLPDREADRPFPVWASNAFSATRIAARGFGADVIRFVHLGRFGSWMQTWKKKK